MARNSISEINPFMASVVLSTCQAINIGGGSREVGMDKEAGVEGLKGGRVEEK